MNTNRTDKERLDWLESTQRGLFRVITVNRKQLTTTNSPYSEDHYEFLGWCVEECGDEELPTVREAIDTAMDK